MKYVKIDKVGSLDNRHSPDMVTPENAVVAQYWDPFRADEGKLATCFGFTSAGFSQAQVIAAFELAGYEFYITGYSGNRQLWKYDRADGSLTQVGDNTTLDIVPRRIVIDPNVYEWRYPPPPTLEERIEYYQAFLFGRNIGSNDTYKPRRIILEKIYDINGVLTDTQIDVIDCAFDTLPVINSMTVTGHAGTAGFTANDEYTYILIFEDIMGNLIYKSDNQNFERIFTVAVDSDYINVLIVFNGDVMTKYGIKKAHLYRANKTVADADGIDSDNPDHHYDTARWVKTFDLEYVGLPSMVFHDTQPTDNTLGDLITPVRNVRKQWMSNINLANQAAGIHRGALWCSLDNDVFFSHYTLEAPFGVRALNFPTTNRWRFDDIGQITDLVSTGDYLYVFGTQGVSMLMGTDLYNFVEKKISSVGSRWPDIEESLVRAPNYDVPEWDKTATVIGDRVYFIGADGFPYRISGFTVEQIPGMMLPRRGSVVQQANPFNENLMLHNPIDATRYRNGWMVTNGSTIYVLDTRTGRWYEWPKGVTRFIQGLDPQFEDGRSVTGSASNYDYFRYVDDNGATQIYRTDGTYPTAIWEIPRIRFDYDCKFDILTIFWQYNDALPYGEKVIDSASRATQAVVGTIDVYLDDKLDSVKTLDFLPDDEANGYYKEVVRLGCRGRRVSFRLSITAGKYFRLCGWEMGYEPLGRKSYE